MISSLRKRLERALASRRLPWFLGPLVALLLLPSVPLGLIVDDFLFRQTELGVEPGRYLPMRPLDLFRFADGTAEQSRRLLDEGILPWWGSPGLRVVFFRPVASASHWLDFHLFPWTPSLMHLESIALYVGVVVAAWALYRRFFGANWAAGLAAFAYAVDPGHAIAAGWIAARNAVLAALFGLLALLAHDRWRREGDRAGAILAPLALLASLGSGESGLGALALLAAHAATLDGPGIGRRASALLPHAAVAALWAAAYRGLGHGASHTVMYIDPVHDLGGYLRAAALHAPVNLGGRLGSLPVSLYVFLAERLVPAFAALGGLFVLLAALALAPVLRTDPVARFFALGALLAALPVSATLPNDRNLFFVGFGALALAVMVVRRAGELASLPLRAYAAYLALIDGVLALLSFPANSSSLSLFARFSREPLGRVLLDDAVRAQTVVFVNPPSPFFVMHLTAMRAGTALPSPRTTRTLAPGIYPVRVRRSGANELTVHVDGGMLPRPGVWPGAVGPSPALKWEYVGQWLTSFVRGADEPLRAGQVVSSAGLRVEVQAVTPDGSPTDVAFRFDHPLEDPSLLWLAWRDGGYVPFVPPPPGESVELPAASMAP